MEAGLYLESIKLALVSSPIVRDIVIIRERGLPDQGFFRARLTLQNGDFVEVTEYFVVETGSVHTVEYRYQWMDAMQQSLRKRWDNAEHHRSLSSFPHHVHIGREDHVEPGQLLSIADLISIIESEMVDPS